MRVYQIEGEPTRFRCESTSLECPACAKLFPRLSSPKNALLRIGDECPACGQGKLDVRFHLVDVAEHHPIGRCTCEHYAFTLGPKVKKLSTQAMSELTQIQARNLRCSHLEAARTAAIDLTIHAHERERMAGAGRQTEENQP